MNETNRSVLGRESMSAAEIVEKALKENPDIWLVLEATERARELEALQPPREIIISTHVGTIPLNSQCLVPQGKRD